MQLEEKKSSIKLKLARLYNTKSNNQSQLDHIKFNTN